MDKYELEIIKSTKIVKNLISGESDSNKIIAILIEDDINQRTMNKLGDDMLFRHDKDYQQTIDRLHDSVNNCNKELSIIKKELVDAGWYAPVDEGEEPLSFWIKGLIIQNKRLLEERS